MELRDYQKNIGYQAALLLQKHMICYLSMQVRTGKTATALHCANVCLAENVLFLTKKKAISSIEGDYNGLGYTYNLTIKNFEQVHNLSAEYDFIICDEAHCLGQYPNPGERTKDLKKIADKCPILYLSGTPSPESESQLYHQFWISSYSPFAEWKNFYKWAKDFVFVKQRRFSHGLVNDYSNANRDKIMQAVEHLFITYSQEQAGFVSDVEEEVIELQMKPGTYLLANKLKKDRLHIGSNGEEVLADTEVKLMGKLHQVYTGSVLCEDGNAIIFDNTKTEYIKKTFAGNRLAIFYKFKAEWLMLCATFGHDRLTSDPQEFKATDKIFCSQIQSGREGINLSSADLIVMLNIDFSAVSYWQARARMQSRERATPCQIKWLFAKDGIEQSIYKAVQDKKDYTLNYFKTEFLQWQGEKAIYKAASLSSLLKQAG